MLVKVGSFKVKCFDDEIVSLNSKRCKHITTSCRKIYSCGSYIIKVDGGRVGGMFGQNAIEWKKYKKIHRSHRKYFAKVLAYKKAMTTNGDKFSILIQRKIEGERSFEDIHVTKACKIGRKYGITDIADEHNFLVIKDKRGREYPIIYDLGL